VCSRRSCEGKGKADTSAPWTAECSWFAVDVVTTHEYGKGGGLSRVKEARFQRILIMRLGILTSSMPLLQMP
jgi:hypothetical protein